MVHSGSFDIPVRFELHHRVFHHDSIYGDPSRLFEPRRILHLFIGYFLAVNLLRTRDSLRMFLTIFLAIVLKSWRSLALFLRRGIADQMENSRHLHRLGGFAEFCHLPDVHGDFSAGEGGDASEAVLSLDVTLCVLQYAGVL